MTGCGVGEASIEGLRLTAELRSLNHRFVDVRVRMPTELAEQSFFVEQWCRENFCRGRYDVSVRAIGDVGDAVLDAARAERLYAAFCEIRDRVAPQQDVPLTLLASIPDLMKQGVIDPSRLRAGLVEALANGHLALQSMRAEEGKTLKHVLADHLARVRQALAWLRTRAPELTNAFRKRLLGRIQRLSEQHDVHVDPARLDAEVVVYADRSDVAEELARLESHIAQFDSLLDQQDEPIGRRLEFLLQELGRETNTLGAKCNDAAVSHKVIELKTELERMREQVQNVE